MIFDILKGGNYTTQEQAVIDYILANPESILHCTAKSLAKLTYVSAPTIARLVKKMGFTSYLEFQLTYAKEYAKKKDQPIATLSKDSSLSDIMDILPKTYNAVFEETKNTLKKEAFVRTINYVMQAINIDFYANDNNHYVVESACFKLNSLGFHARAFNTIDDHYVDSLDPKQAISFVISHTGNNQTMLENAKYLRKKGIRVIAITGYINSQLEPLCNESLHIDLNVYDLPRELRLYGVSILYILDILVTAVALKKR